MVIWGFDIGAAFTPDVSLFEMVARGVILERPPDHAAVHDE